MSDPGSMGAAPHRRCSRRRLLAAAPAGVVGAGLVLPGCGSRSLHEQVKKAGPAAVAQDIALLSRLLDLENHAIAAYTAGVPLLAHDSARAARRFLAQELDHASGLAGLIKVAGAKAPKPRPSYELGHPQTSEDVLRLLHRVESTQLAVYLEVIPRLRPGPVRAEVGAFFANDAQHVAVVGSLLGESPVPAAFVTGQR